MCDRLAEICASEFDAKVDRLVAAHKRGHILVATPFFRERPVPIDGIPQLKRLVRNALRARAWFLRQGPAWGEHENILCSGFSHRHFVVYYSNSLQGRDFEFLGHPLLYDYCRGAMASHVGEPGLWEDPQLLKEFPPKPLAGLDEQGRWRPLPNRASQLLEEIFTR